VTSSRAVIEAAICLYEKNHDEKSWKKG